MSSLQRLVITTPGTADDFKSECDLAPGQLVAMNNFISYLGGVAGGAIQGASLAFNVGAVQATGTLTVAAGGSANDQTCSVCNVTFTAKTSGATGNQFNISATAATQATNMAAAFNASANLAGKVTAVAVDGVVTITSVVPGLMGNGLGLSAGTLANVTLGAFANGTDGTSYTLDLD
jgi:hypothetical protein